MIPYNKEFVPNAKVLRKSMTREEKHLWYDFSKKLPVTVKRQHNYRKLYCGFLHCESQIGY